MSDERVFPFKPGDWVSNDADRVAQVKSVYGEGDEVLLDLVLYDWKGDKVGRESPACGGPRTFEPACSAEGWERVAEPDFPIRPTWVPTADGSGLVSRMWAGERLPPANWKPRPRRRTAVRPPQDDALRRALQAIADGHNDPRTLARTVLGRT